MSISALALPGIRAPQILFYPALLGTMACTSYTPRIHPLFWYMMARIIFLLVLIAVLYYVIKRMAASWLKGSAPGQAQKKLVQCSQCGTHVPENESIVVHGQYYCSNPQCNPESAQNDSHDN